LVEAELGNRPPRAGFGEAFGCPVIELDKHFWQPGLVPLPGDRWVKVQQNLASQPRWVMDGDLGPYDALAVRSLQGRYGSIPRYPVVALLVASPPTGQRKLGFLVVADHLGMAGTTENPWLARRARSGGGAYIPLGEGTRPVSVQAPAGMMTALR